jgi:hypothetical protein
VDKIRFAMRMGTTRLAMLVAAAAVVCMAPGGAAAQSSSPNYKIPLSTLNNGIANIASANFKVSSSLGDAFFTGPLTSTNYRLSPGFWFPSGSAAAPLFMNAVSRKAHGAATFNLLLAP